MKKTRFVVIIGGILRLPSRRAESISVRLTRWVAILCECCIVMLTRATLVAHKSVAHHFCHHYVYYLNRVLLTETHVLPEMGGLSLPFCLDTRRNNSRAMCHLYRVISRLIALFSYFWFVSRVAQDLPLYIAIITGLDPPPSK